MVEKFNSTNSTAAAVRVLKTDWEKFKKISMSKGHLPSFVMRRLIKDFINSKIQITLED